MSTERPVIAHATDILMTPEQRRQLLVQREFLRKYAADDAARAASPKVPVIVISGFTVRGDDPHLPAAGVYLPGQRILLPEFDLARFRGRVLEVSRVDAPPDGSVNFVRPEPSEGARLEQWKAQQASAAL